MGKGDSSQLRRASALPLCEKKETPEKKKKKTSLLRKKDERDFCLPNNRKKISYRHNHGFRTEGEGRLISLHHKKRKERRKKKNIF